MKAWQRRRIVCRVCLVTDTKMFLLDEDYNSEGHKALKSTHLADASYMIINEVTLKQVAKVQQVAVDPAAITIYINHLGHFWRTR
jgi:hypothetical protein